MHEVCTWSDGRAYYTVQVTIGRLEAGTQYTVVVEVVLTGDHPGPETTLVISTTGKNVYVL